MKTEKFENEGRTVGRELEEQAAIGQEIADIFMLKTDTANGHSDRYRTSWGSKTPYGLYNMLMEIAYRITRSITRRGFIPVGLMFLLTLVLFSWS